MVGPVWARSDVDIGLTAGVPEGILRSGRALTKHSFNYQTPAVVATTIVSFAVSYAVLSWRPPGLAPQTQEAPGRGAGGTADERMGPGPGPGIASSSSMQVAENSGAGSLAAPAKRAVATAAVLDTTVPPSNYEGLPLPVMFNIVNKSVYTTEETPQGTTESMTKRVNEAIIFNTSEGSLSITVLDVNVPTQETSQTQFMLPKGAQKHFGVDQGLKMQSGDQITLRSANFRDLETRIP
jgi:hypothetical protein